MRERERERENEREREREGLGFRASLLKLRPWPLALDWIAVPVLCDRRLYDSSRTRAGNFESRETSAFRSTRLSLFEADINAVSPRTGRSLPLSLSLALSLSLSVSLPL